MINYASTDKSVEIIKNICPSWQIVDSINENFNAVAIDSEVEEYEKTITGWRICLNITEFLVGNYQSLTPSLVPEQKAISVCLMVEKPETMYQQTEIKDILKEKINGLSPEHCTATGQRSIHNFSLKYPLGRHFRHPEPCQDFVILKYIYSPWNEQLIQRKLQIKHRIPQSEFEKGLGLHHAFCKERLEHELRRLQKDSQDLSEIIKINETPLKYFL
jgi:hypothetical protein